MTCAKCHCIRAALAEVGMDPDRVLCSEDGPGVCSVGCGLGSEGRTAEEVEAIVDRAIAVCARIIGGDR